MPYIAQTTAKPLTMVSFVISVFSVNLNTELFEGLPIGGFELDAEAEAAIVAFLKTLTDGYQPPAD